jgi:NRAMP (natural resistance-associated macrophage protein)-like metal ion transporter
MINWIKHWKKRIIFALAIVGPGLITAFADNDAAGVSTYSVSAATFGYSMLIITIPMTILLAVTQEIGSRIAIVAEKGLADLIRERYGVRVAIAMFVLMFIVNMAVIVMNIGGIKSALELFGLPAGILLPAIITALFVFVTVTKYNTIERFFFVLIGFYFTYAISAFLAKPDWTMATTALFIPQGSITPQFIYTAIAVIGTTVTLWGQFFINSYVKDKRLNVEHLRYNRAEIYIGAILTDSFSFFMMVAVIATLYAHNIPITDAAQAARAIAPFAGNFAGILFGVGLFIAGTLGCIVVSLTTAYAFSEFFGYSGSLDENFRKSRLFYTTLLIQLLVGTIIVTLPQVSLFAITLVGNFVNGGVLPVIFYFLYQFANNEQIMGEHRNTRLQNIILGGSAIFISVATLFSLVGQFLGF